MLTGSLTVKITTWGKSESLGMKLWIMDPLSLLSWYWLTVSRMDKHGMNLRSTFQSTNLFWTDAYWGKPWLGMCPPNRAHAAWSTDGCSSWGRLSLWSPASDRDGSTSGNWLQEWKSFLLVPHNLILTTTSQCGQKVALQMFEDRYWIFLYYRLSSRLNWGLL